MAGKRILHLTDPHLFAAEDGELRGVRTAETLGIVLDAALTADRRPDAIVVSGDIAQDESSGAYRRFRDMLSDMDTRILCLPGNHDDPALMAELLNEAPFQCGGIAEAGDWRIHLLSTWIAGEAHGRLGDEALAALERDLGAHRAAPALVFLHHHPVPTGSRWLDRLGLEDAESLLALADRHPQLRGLVWGHIHQTVDSMRGRCRLLATPSTCRQFLPQSETFAVDTRPPAWRWLYLGDDGQLATELRWLGES